MFQRPDSDEHEAEVLEKVKLLIGWGVDLNAVDHEGRTALDGAMEVGVRPGGCLSEGSGGGAREPDAGISAPGISTRPPRRSNCLQGREMKHFSIVAAASIACFACSAGEDTTADEPRGTQANEAPDAQADEALAAQAEKLRQILAEAPRLSGDVAPVEMIPPREGWELGMVSWIAAGDDGLIYLLQRGDQADPVIALDRTGRVVRSWGSGMYATPHSIRVDPDGNIWTADAKSSRVLKFAHDGTLLMEIAVGGQPEDCDGNFCGTTDVAFAPDGHVFIADGYRNARILEYTPDGQRVGEWGSPGTGPGEFRLPHSLAVDEDGIVYVADRENGRIQTFERDGTFLSEWPDYGKTFSLDLAPGAVWLGSQHRNEPNVSPGWLIQVDARTGDLLGYVDATGIHGIDRSGSGELLVAPGLDGNPQLVRMQR